MRDRADTIARIREGLRKRSGKAWSVTGGRGTAWGWLTIDAPPARRTWHRGPEIEAGGAGSFDERHAWTNDPTRAYGSASLQERCELAALLDLAAPVHCQGVSVPPDSWEVYARKAEGTTGLHEPEHGWD